MIAELLAKIKVDVSDLSKAGEAAKEFEGTLKGAFRRTGDMRVGRSLEEFIQNLTSGNVGGAIESIAGKLTGLGLVGGTAMASLGAGVTYLISNLHQYEEALKNASQTAKEKPLKGATVEEDKAHIDSTIKVLESLGNKFKNFWVDFVEAPSMGGSVAQRLEARSKALNQLSDDLTNEIAKQRESLETETLASAVGDQSLAQVKAHIDAEEKYNKIRDEKIKQTEALGKMHVTPEQESGARAAIGETARESREIVNERVGLIDREVQLTHDLAAAKLTMLPPELQEIEAHKIKIAYMEQVRNALAGNNVEARKALDYAIQQEKLQMAHAAAVREIKDFQPLFEKSQMSLQELLQASPQGGSVGRIEAHQAALRAQREMDLAEQARKGGFEEDAFRHMIRAEQIKAGIPILKESEKTPEFAFMTAIDSAKVFQNMLTYLQDIAKSVGNQINANPFLNR